MIFQKSLCTHRRAVIISTMTTGLKILLLQPNPHDTSAQAERFLRHAAPTTILAMKSSTDHPTRRHPHDRPRSVEGQLASRSPTNHSWVIPQTASRRNTGLRPVERLKPQRIIGSGMPENAGTSASTLMGLSPGQRMG